MFHSPSGSRRRALLLSAACTGLLTLPPAAGRAQMVPPSSGAILHQVVPPPAPLTAPEDVLTLPAPTEQISDSTVHFRVRQLIIAGNQEIDSTTLHALVAGLEGQDVTLGQLQTQVARITEAYEQAGYPVAYAFLPAQKVHDGIIQIEVVEPHYDQILPTGQSRLRDAMTLRTVGVASGDPIALAPLERGLLLLNQTPGVQVKGTLVPGAAVGTSTLQLERQDQPVVSGSLSENNQGNRYTGAYLSSATVSAANLFGFGGSLAATAISSDTGGMRSGGLQATSPNLWDGLRAGFYGSSTAYHLGGAFANLDQVGQQNQLGGDLNYPLILRPGRQVSVQLDVLNTWLSQDTQSVGDVSTQSILIERLSLEGVLADGWNGTTTINLALAHGDTAIGTAWGRAQDTAGPHTAGSYETIQMRLGREQSLPGGFQWTGSVSGQLANHNLNSSQQFYLGGPYGVMSYAVGEGAGDEGYLLLSSLSHELPLTWLPGTLSGAVLAQNGGVRVHHTLWPGATGPNTLNESGAGASLSWYWRGIDVSASYIRRIGANTEPGFDMSRDQFWLQATLGF
jgi:hemolysin activation/secretion protein